MLRIILAVFAAVSLSAALPAQAEVITGPALTYARGWNVTGVGFTANRNSALTGFTFQNTGKADTIVLTDNAGTILYSVATAAGTTSLPVSINWGLSSGATYWLLQTTDSNNLFAFYAPATLPSNADITMVRTGAFNSTIVDAVTNSNFARRTSGHRSTTSPPATLSPPCRNRQPGRC